MKLIMDDGTEYQLTKIGAVTAWSIDAKEPYKHFTVLLDRFHKPEPSQHTEGLTEYSYKPIIIDGEKYGATLIIKTPSYASNKSSEREDRSSEGAIQEWKPKSKTNWFSWVWKNLGM